jgi:hypothetical protein
MSHSYPQMKVKEKKKNNVVKWSSYNIIKHTDANGWNKVKLIQWTENLKTKSFILMWHSAFNELPIKEYITTADVRCILHTTSFKTTCQTTVLC